MFLAISFSPQQGHTRDNFRTLKAEREENAALLKGGLFCSCPKIQAEWRTNNLETIKVRKAGFSTPS